jgi:DNA-binding NtrC family response regulator
LVAARAKVNDIEPKAVVEASRPRALIVDDDRRSRDGLAELIGGEGFEPLTASSIADARALLERESIDLALVDLQLPDGSGIDLVLALEDRPEVEVVMVTGHGTIDSAVEALRGGAVDYLIKPVDVRRLKRLLVGVRRTWSLRDELRELRGCLRDLGRFGEMVGASPPMQAVYDLIVRVAPTKSTCLVRGETGVGKELVARMVHDLSPRAGQAFVSVNCGAIAPTLIESELFGHEKGSFTNADRQRLGLFERAHRGTLFLDEITEMPPELQVRLLRVLEEGRLTRVGGDEPIEVDVRLVAATNRDLSQAVEAGALRQDLHYRLNVFPIAVPPLRERGDDVRLLAQHFLSGMNRTAEASKRFDETALESLERHAWPGNVRELKNVIERAWIMAGERITARNIQLDGAPPVSGDEELRIALGTSIADAERKLILATLERVNANKQQAAKILGISLKTLYNRLSAYGV